jgi:hypothetical protein
MKRVHHLVALGLLGALLAASSAQADSVTYSFVGGSVTNNSTINSSVGGQFEFTVTDLGGGQVSFTFVNVSSDTSVASSITDIYFDDLTQDTDQVLLSIASVTNSTGVAFTAGSANPGDLPGGTNATPDFTVTTGLLTDSDPPAQPSGINPGESLTVTFNLVGGKTFQDVILSLANGAADPYTTPALRVGIHVQGYADGGSESFLNGPAPVVRTPPEAPLPPVAIAGIALMGGLGGLQRLRRRVCAA